MEHYVILQGKKRFEIDTVVSEEPYITAIIKEFEKVDQKVKTLSFSYS
jgi:ATP-dependent Lon protease